VKAEEKAKELHCSNDYAHLGTKATFDMARRTGLTLTREQIKKIIDACHTCQVNKSLRELLPTRMTAVPDPDNQEKVIAVDIM
jgi:Integrase zinc binding domain